MNLFLLGRIIVAVFVAMVSCATAIAADLRSCTASSRTVPEFGLLDLTVDLPIDYSNPFDPDQIDLWADFVSPHGVTRHVDGFLYQPYRRNLAGGREQLSPAGIPVWKIWFAPNDPGVWHYTVHARDRASVSSLAASRFRCLSSQSAGFVRLSALNPLGFAFDSGAPFFPIGEDMAWGGDAGSYDYDKWLPDFASNGGDWIRLWMTTNNCSIEWTDSGKADVSALDEAHKFDGFRGLGVYNLANAWKLDEILDTAARNRVYVMLTFGTYGDLTTGGYFGEGQWPSNPYNSVNSGPCSTPADFWTNPTALRRYRQRLRYICARYGWRTNLQAWELWNETPAPVGWVDAMSSYLKGNGPFTGEGADPYRHLVTTTWGSDQIWKLTSIDFTQSHTYGTGNITDFAPAAHDDAQQSASFGKPHLMAEFGIDWRKPDSSYDPLGLGVNLHNAIWAAAMSGDAGSAMIWWWDNYVFPKSLTREFKPLRDFTRDVPWARGRWGALRIDPPRSEVGKETFSDLTLSVNGGWGKPSQTSFTVDPVGFASAGALPSYLYGSDKPDMQAKVDFHVNYARPGRFGLVVDQVSSVAHLRFWLDGNPIKDYVLSAAPPTDGSAPEYQSTQAEPQWHSYLATFDKEYYVAVPAGSHVVTAGVLEGDWLSLTQVILSGYRSSRYPMMNIYGLHNGRSAILWAQNALHSWSNVAAGKTIPEIRGATSVIHGLPQGRYWVGWWTDTEHEKLAKPLLARCINGALRISIPDTYSDVAAKIEWASR